MFFLFQAFAVFRMLFVFFWVIPRRLIYICRRFGTLYLFHLHLPLKMEQIVFRNVGIYKSDAGESPKRKQTTLLCFDFLTLYLFLECRDVERLGVRNWRLRPGTEMVGGVFLCRPRPYMDCSVWEWVNLRKFVLCERFASIDVPFPANHTYQIGESNGQWSIINNSVP